MAGQGVTGVFHIDVLQHEFKHLKPELDVLLQNASHFSSVPPPTYCMSDVINMLLSNCVRVCACALYVIYTLTLHAARRQEHTCQCKTKTLKFVFQFTISQFYTFPHYWNHQHFIMNTLPRKVHVLDFQNID